MAIITKSQWVKDLLGNKTFAWSHVKTVFYNRAKNILLKDKLDQIDAAISKQNSDLLFEYKEVSSNGIIWLLWIFKYKSYRSIVARGYINNVPVSTVWGGIFASPADSLNTEFPYPEEFNTAPLVFSSFVPSGGTNAWTQLITTPSTNKSPQVQLLRGISSQGVSGYIEIMAVGDIKG